MYIPGKKPQICMAHIGICLNRYKKNYVLS